MTSVDQVEAHTSGPWRVVEMLCVGGPSPCVVGRGDKEVASTGCCDNPEANARLIAAAPELLDALQWVTTALEQAEAGYPDPRADQAVELARAAISRATGAA